MDNPEDAMIGALVLCELALSLSASDDLDDDLEDILREYEERSGRALMHNVCFY